MRGGRKLRVREEVGEKKGRTVGSREGRKGERVIKEVEVRYGREEGARKRRKGSKEREGSGGGKLREIKSEERGRSEVGKERKESRWDLGKKEQYRYIILHFQQAFNFASMNELVKI